MRLKPLAFMVFQFSVAAHVHAYRLSGGRVGARYRLGAGFRKPAPVLLLDHRGRKSGKLYTVPLIYARDGEHFLVTASQGGAPSSPNWYHNLEADPATYVQAGAVRLQVSARVADEDERHRLWPLVVDAFSDYSDYQAKTTRIIPVVVLTPVTTRRRRAAFRQLPPGHGGLHPPDQQTAAESL